MATTDLPAETETPPVDKGPAHGALPRRILKWLAIAATGLILLVGALLLALNSDPGRRWVAERIAQLEFESGLEIGIGEIEGSIYGEMALRNFTLADERGVFLRSPLVRLDWRPFAYLRNKVDLRSLTAETVILQRLPELRETDPDAPLLPDLDIDIGAFRIDRFIAEAPVSGERRIASLEGTAKIADRRAQVRLGASTIAGGGRGGGDRLALVLDAVPEANRLKLDLDLEAPAGGVIAAMTGASEPLVASLKGNGDWANWAGRLEADYAGAEAARLSITAKDGTFTVRGPARVSRLFEEPLAGLLGPVLDLDMTGALNERRIDLDGRLASDAARINTNGVVDLGTSRFDGLRVGVVVLRPSALAENLRGSGLRGQFVLDGDFATPVVEYTANAAQLVLNDMGLQQFSMSGKAEVDADRILIPVNARAARITGLDTVAGGRLDNVRLAGDVAIQGPRVLSDNMRVRSDRLDARVVLLGDLSTGLYTGAIDGKIDNYRVETVGIFDLDTDVDLEATRTGYALAGTLRARSRQLDNAGVRDFLGGNLVASANVRYGADGVARFTNLRLTSPLVRVNGGSGSYAPDGSLTIDARGVTERYGPVGMRVAGTIANPRATIVADRPDFGIGLANVRAAVTRAGNAYRLDARGDTDYGPLTADVLVGTGNALTLDIRSANLSGIDFAGSLRQVPAGPFVGRLTAQGQGVDGIVRLQAAGKFQEALVNLRARDTRLPGPVGLSVGSAIVDARVVLYATPYVVADAQLADTRIGQLDLAAGRAKIDYRDGRGSARFLAEGVSGVPFRIAGNAALTPELWRASLAGRVRGIPFKTVSPARIIPRRDAYELLPTQIDLGSGGIRLAGTYGDGIKIQSRLDALDLAIANTFNPGLGVGGKATGSLDFEQVGPSAFPRADARLRIAGFTRTTAVSVSQPVDVNFVGKLLADGGEARAVMRRRGSVIGRLVASLRPLPPGSGSWTTRLLEAPLSGGIRYNGPADTLVSFAAQPNQRLSGPIGLAADFSGRVSNPQLAGIVRGKNLVYENAIYGTRLSAMTLSGRFAGDRLEIQQLEATAGSGSVAASGFISLSEDRGYPMELAAKLTNARLARSDALSATATGDLKLTKAAGETALLSGALVLPDARYKVVRQGAASVPELTGVRFKPRRARQRITGNERTAASPPLFDLIRLDVALDAPERLFIEGMGLESEWNANLRLTGTSAAPRLTGQVDLERGTLDFAGRSFEIGEGRVRFLGGTTIDPQITIVASDEIEGVTVRVNVTGRAYDPQISFTSVPGLPQDEILSRVLFGESIGNLSAIQAVQLAASLNSLRGSGGGLDPLGKLRSATGIDRLRILGADEASGRGTALAAGQYITNDIYVEFITDARGFTATQLEISLTRALSILSQTGGSGSTNVNVRYRKDY